MELDYEAAKTTLSTIFDEAEAAFQASENPGTSEKAVAKDLAAIFTSKTQAYREAFIGTILARLQDKNINLTLPYVKHGPTAYHARELDQSAINPFLKEKQIPSSGGPFLSSLRRGIKFTKSTAVGIRDKIAYSAFVRLVKHAQSINDDQELHKLLHVVLYQFVQLREASTVSVAHVNRLSIPQYETLIDGLLKVPSGGRFPVYLVVATLQALNETLKLAWDIQHQGINVADAADSQAGDITISVNSKVLLAAEVTERVVEKSRVVSTFASKIGPHGIEDYIFFVKFKASGADPEAVRQAQQYFAQGHEVSFVDIKTWCLNTLVSFGKGARLAFNTKMAGLLEATDVPAKMKVAWNDQIQKLTKV